MTELRPKQCYVSMPMAGEFTDLYQRVIKPAIVKAGWLPLNPNDLPGIARLEDSITALLNHADFVLGLVSRGNRNVLYELGIAWGLGKPIVLLAESDKDIAGSGMYGTPVLYYGMNATSNQFGSNAEDLRSGIHAYLTGERKAYIAPDITTNQNRILRSRIESLESELATVTAALRERQSEEFLASLNKPATTEVELLAENIASRIEGLFTGTVTGLQQELAESRVTIDRLTAEETTVRAAQAELEQYRGKMAVNPFWPGRDAVIENDLCFVLMPFGKDWSDGVWGLLQDAIRAVGMRPDRADERDGRIIMHDIWEGICKARVIIADLSAPNPNVAYEVGMADVLGKDMILISQTTDVPFDFRHNRLVPYEDTAAGALALSRELVKKLSGLAAR